MVDPAPAPDLIVAALRTPSGTPMSDDGEYEFVAARLVDASVVNARFERSRQDLENINEFLQLLQLEATTSSLCEDLRPDRSVRVFDIDVNPPSPVALSFDERSSSRSGMSTRTWTSATMASGPGSCRIATASTRREQASRARMYSRLRWVRSSASSPHRRSIPPSRRT